MSTNNKYTLRGLEFYSGLGAFHYGATLFNHMVRNIDFFVPNTQNSPNSQNSSPNTLNWYQNHLKNNPNVLHPLVNDIYLPSAPQYQPNPSTSQNDIKTDHKIPQISIIESFDINPIANCVYLNNFHRQPNTTDISILTSDQIKQYHSDIWFISNPCQPFTIQNDTNLDENDPRTNSFLHLLEVLRDLVRTKNEPRFLVLENVENFELSFSYQILLQTLKESSYNTVSFILSPRQFGIPNQRSRFFLIASKIHQPFEHFEAKFASLVPKCAQLSEKQPPQVVYRYLPTFHFIPDEIQGEYFGSNFGEQSDQNLGENGGITGLEAYKAVWNDPDSAFDVLHCTVQLPTMSDDDKDGEKSEKDEKNDAIISSSVSHREHNKTRLRIVQESWLPAVIPDKIEKYLVDFTDLSQLSQEKFQKLFFPSENEQDGNGKNEENFSDTTTSTSDTNTTMTSPLMTETDIHILINYVKNMQDIDEITHISKKEKNKLKRLFTKNNKKVENKNNNNNSQNSKITQISTAERLKHRQRLITETAEAAVLDPSTFLKPRAYTIDIVSPQDRSTCCFTKGYATYFKGTGSILETFRPKNKDKIFSINPIIFTKMYQKYSQNFDQNSLNSFYTSTPLSLKLPTPSHLTAIISPDSNTPLLPQSTEDNETNNSDFLLHLTQEAPLALRGLRYFLPREVANLQMLPPSRTQWVAQYGHKEPFPYFASFDWPQSEGLTTKQKLKLLGNSLNSYIIANLLLVLLGKASFE
jgi:site-specific DNA-cytosine methylase